MNNEIKEIIEELRKTADNSLFVVCSSQEELDKIPKYTANFLSVNDRQAKILLDYITNLQSKIEAYELFDNQKIAKLQEENKELNDDSIWWNNRFKAVQRDYEDYKSRNDKAIEYIENNFISYEDSRTFGQLGEEIKIQVKEIRDLLKILQGSDKDE